MDKPHSDRLEVLVHTPQGNLQTKPTPLLFVHGAFTGAWCWEEHFLPFFAEHGYASYALSFSGHGASKGRERLDSLGIKDYVADIAETVSTLSAPPVLIGHSMGGYVVQKYLEQYSAPAAVLMCSVPPQGLMSAAFGMAFNNPGMMGDLNNTLVGGNVSLETLRNALFAQPISVEELTRYCKNAQPESQRAIWDMTLLNLPNPHHMHRVPLLVLGAEHDHVMPASLAEMTARTYSVTAEIFPAMGHGLMLESDWLIPAQRILDWLKEQKL